MIVSAVAWAFLAMLLWGAAPILGKLGLARTDPFLGLLVRNGTAFLILVTGLLVAGRLRLPIPVDARSGALLAGEGIVASLLAQLAYYWALKLGSPARVAPLAAAYPLITVLLSLILLREHLSWMRVAGALLVVGGVILLGR